MNMKSIVKTVSASWKDLEKSSNDLIKSMELEGWALVTNNCSFVTNNPLCCRYEMSSNFNIMFVFTRNK